MPYLYLFFFDLPTCQTLGRIFARDSSKDAKSRKDVPFGVIKLKFNFKHLFIPKIVQFWPKTGVFSTENA